MLVGMFRFLRRIWPGAARPLDSSGKEPYRVFTREFDVVIEADKLDSILGPLPPAEKAAYEEACAIFDKALAGWRTKADLVALDAMARIRAVVGDASLADTAVAILVDNSGSMRGQRALLAAAACDVAQDFLGILGIAREVLGFTTVSWKGGKSRLVWQGSWRPSNPGRLCDLLHIIYIAAEPNRWGHKGGGGRLKPMLRHDVLKENVDGEAIEWAVGRLRKKPARRRVLVVISDGAPVDDSTLSANPPDILERHLREVIHRIKEAGDVQLVGIGIANEYDITSFYPTAVTVETPEDLGTRLIEALEKAICQASALAKSNS